VASFLRLRQICLVAADLARETEAADRARAGSTADACGIRFLFRQPGSRFASSFSQATKSATSGRLSEFFATIA